MMVWVEVGGVCGQSGGNAEKGLPEGSTHGLVDIAGLPAADSDKCIRDLGERAAEGDKPLQRFVGGGTGKFHRPGGHPRCLEQLRNFHAVFRIEKGVNNRQCSGTIIGRKDRQIPEFTRPLDIVGRGLKGAGFFGFFRWA